MIQRVIFDILLPPSELECGAPLPTRVVRGWAAGPPGIVGHLAACGAHVVALDEQIHGRERVVSSRGPIAYPDPPPAPKPSPWPVINVVHALTGDMRVSGPGGWWDPVVGPGEPLDPTTHLIVCFNNLGGCYGTTGPDDFGFPKRSAETAPLAPPAPRGAFTLPPDTPATVTPWDQARTHLEALDAIGVGDIDMLIGGSAGGMQAICMAMLEPRRVGRLVPVASSLDAPPWIIAWNHVSRQIVLADRSMRGLELARQVAHITYRSPASLIERYGRQMTTAEPDAWSSRANYAIQTYLEHQGRKLTARFAPDAYLCALDAMDHHDALRRPPWVDAAGDWTLARITAPTTAIVIDTDVLFVPDSGHRIADDIRGAGGTAQAIEIHSPHGHDAFLIEWEQVRQALRAAWELAAD